MNLTLLSSSVDMANQSLANQSQQILLHAKEDVCLLLLMKTGTRKVIAQFSFNVNFKRDLTLAIAFVALAKNLAKKQESVSEK